MMNDQEKAELKAEIINELREAGMLKDPSTQKRSVLKEPYDKWFNPRSENEMSKAFMFPNDKCKVWESVRRLVCLIVGANNVMQIKSAEEATEICEKLCQFVYDLRKEHLSNGTDGKNS